MLKLQNISIVATEGFSCKEEISLLVHINIAGRFGLCVAQCGRVCRKRLNNFLVWKEGRNRDMLNHLYTALVVIHVLAVILGVGPVFLFNTILMRAQTADKLQYAHLIIGKLNRNANLSYGIILLSGLAMGWIYPWLFQMEWYIASLVLFFISGIYAMTAIEPVLKRMKGISDQSVTSEIPQEYEVLFQKKKVREWVANSIVIVIILLMIIKPVF